MTAKEPTFMIGSVPIYGDLILAPMDGITDNPFRALCRGLGSAMVVTDSSTPDVIEDNPAIPSEQSHRRSTPVSLQILGNDPNGCSLQRSLWSKVSNRIFWTSTWGANPKT